jgi:hypothetical protein
MLNKNLIITLSIILIVIIAIGVYLMVQPKPRTSQNQENQNNTPESYDIQGMKVEILKQGTGPEAKASPLEGTMADQRWYPWMPRSLYCRWPACFSVLMFITLDTRLLILIIYKYDNRAPRKIIGFSG